MWKCAICDADVEDDSWDRCWKCSSPRALSPEEVKTLRAEHQARMESASSKPCFGDVHLPPKARVIILGLIGVAVGVIGLSSQNAGEREYFAMLVALTPRDVTRIIVSDQHDVTLASITHSEALTSFVNISKAFTRDRPNHPQYTSTFYIDLYLTNGKKYGFECHTMERPDSTIYITFVRRWGMITLCDGGCKSSSLIGWIQKQIPALLNEQ